MAENELLVHCICYGTEKWMLSCNLLLNTLANMSNILRELNFSNAAATQYIRGCRV